MRDLLQFALILAAVLCVTVVPVFIQIILGGN